MESPHTSNNSCVHRQTEKEGNKVERKKIRLCCTSSDECVMRSWMCASVCVCVLFSCVCVMCGRERVTNLVELEGGEDKSLLQQIGSDLRREVRLLILSLSLSPLLSLPLSLLTHPFSFSPLSPPSSFLSSLYLSRTHSPPSLPSLSFSLSLVWSASDVLRRTTSRPSSATQTAMG